ncbi:MAG TPA: GTP cyclohydrolase II [Pirellulales bacterium]|nr:GTP cyclohydrolase II [Pirellulales bacterium]
MNGISPVHEIIAEIRAGRMVVLVDEEDRENEGDFICAAEKVTPAIVNFMLKHGRGQVCVPVLPEVCERLKLTPMVDQNTAPLRTAFTVAVDHGSARTGITAQEKATTILALIDPRSQPADFVRPGHMYPIMAKEGGVLRRAGHTEAAIDLARLAGLYPAGVLCEILGESGDRANREELIDLARHHRLEITTIEELIRHRRAREKLVYRQAECQLPTHYGPATCIYYGVKYESQEPFALVFGTPTTVAAPLVRLHSSCLTGDLLNSLRCDCGDQLRMALEMICQEGTGVLIYLPQEGRGIGLAHKIKAYSLQDKGMDTVEANQALGFKADMRDYGVGIQILKDLGLSKVRLLTNNPKKTNAFIYDGFDLEVVDQVPIVAPINEHNARYLATKREKLGHHLPGA